MSRLKEYFSKKTDKEIFAILLFFSCLILMTVLVVFRFCGIGYFANEYEEQEVIGANQTITVTTEGTQSVASSFAAVVRVNACNTSALSITSSAAITVTNATLKVVED